jgi:hypothetical protein
LDKAGDRVAVLRLYFERISLMGWVEANLAASITLLDVLKTHTDPAVVQFATRESTRLAEIVVARYPDRAGDERFE